MLDVPDVEDLVFKLRHVVPRKPALGGGEIQRVDAAIDHVIADAPVFEHFVARERVYRAWEGVSFPGNGHR